MDCPIVYKILKEALPLKKVESLLIKAERGEKENFINKFPLGKPRAGQIFLYRLQSPQDNSHLKDEYVGFRNVGNNKKKDKIIPVLKRYYKIRNHEQDKGYLNLAKEVSCLTSPITPNTPVFLIQYLGNEKDYKERDETMSKDTVSPSSSDVNNLVTLKSDITAVDRLLRAEIYNIVEMAKLGDFNDYIIHVQVAPYDLVILCHSTCISLANKILEENAVCSDNTVFRMIEYKKNIPFGKISISILSVKNKYFETDPAIDVALMLHSDTSTELHKVFLKMISARMPLISEYFLEELLSQIGKNELYQSLDKWKEQPLDTVVAAMYMLQIDSLKELKKSYEGKGRYELKPDAKKVVQRHVKIISTTSCHISFTSDELLSYAETPVLGRREKPLSLKTKFNSTQEIASQILESNFISISGKARVFTIRDPVSSLVYTVKKNPGKETLSCSCSNVRNCSHRLAVWNFLSGVPKEKKSYKLNVLKRGRKKSPKKISSLSAKSTSMKSELIHNKKDDESFISDSFDLFKSFEKNETMQIDEENNEKETLEASPNFEVTNSNSAGYLLVDYVNKELNNINEDSDDSIDPSKVLSFTMTEIENEDIKLTNKESQVIQGVKRILKFCEETDYINNIMCHSPKSSITHPIYKEHPEFLRHAKLLTHQKIRESKSHLPKGTEPIADDVTEYSIQELRKLFMKKEIINRGHPEYVFGMNPTQYRVNVPEKALELKEYFSKYVSIPTIRHEKYFFDVILYEFLVIYLIKEENITHEEAKQRV